MKFSGVLFCMLVSVVFESFDAGVDMESSEELVYLLISGVFESSALETVRRFSGRFLGLMFIVSGFGGQKKFFLKHRFTQYS